MQVQVKLDAKLVMKSIVVLLVCFVPITYIHEMGHQIGCRADGLVPETQILFYPYFAGNTQCTGGELTNSMLYYGLGGTFSTLVVLIPLVNWKWVKEKRYPLIAMFTFATGESITAIIETFLHESYATNVGMWSTVMGVLYVLFFTIFAIVWGKGKAN